MKPRLPPAIYAIGATSLLNDASSEMIFPLLPVFLSSVLGAVALLPLSRTGGKVRL
jgi:hypothetical protein